MKKFIAYVVSWSFYCIGHVFSIPLQWHNFFVPICFRPYQFFMGKSGIIQDWAGNKTPWVAIKE